LLEEYGPLPKTWKRKIEQEENIESLNQWLKLAATAGSIEEFIRKAK